MCHTQNLLTKLNDFKNYLKLCQHRKLTVHGRKSYSLNTFAIPKIIYPLTVLPTPPDHILRDIEHSINTFMCDGKIAKIKHNILIQTIDNGGISIPNIKNKLHIAKASWVKRLVDDKNKRLVDDKNKRLVDDKNKRLVDDKNKSSCNTLYNSILNKYGGKLVFESDIDQADVKRMFKNNIFLSEIIQSWQFLKNKDTTPPQHKTVVWNNSSIKQNNTTLIYPKWLDKGIKYIYQLFDFRTNYTFEEFMFIYDIPDSDFLKYQTLVNSIPVHY